MNINLLVTDNWSNPDSEDLHTENWPGEPDVLAQRERGDECRNCSFWATFGDQWGLCCFAESRHHLETVFEHFTCPSFVEEGVGPHSFTKNTDAHCVCHGRGTKYLERFSTILESIEAEDSDLVIEEPAAWPEGLFGSDEPTS